MEFTTLKNLPGTYSKVKNIKKLLGEKIFASDTSDKQLLFKICHEFSRFKASNLIKNKGKNT